MSQLLRKTILGILLVLFLVGMAQAEANAPVLFFSDLTSGPKIGWSVAEPNKGAAVTVWGRNFGSTRGTSYITVNGAQLTQDSDYAEWGVNGGGVANIPGLQRITFWLNNNCQDGQGTITLTVQGQTSNSLPFSVRTGRIFFVDINSPNDPGSGTHEDPWRSPVTFYSNIVPGDICYFRQGTYSGTYGYGGISWGTNFVIGTTKGGTSDNPVAFVSYPGETATFFADSGSSPTINFKGQTIDGPSNIVVAKLRLIARSGSVRASTGWRVVGNYCDAVHTGGIAIIKPWYDNVKILGNELTGGASGNKLDHAIYPSEGENMELGWNYIHDNNFGIGPMISNNHDGAFANGWVFENYHIHDNIVDINSAPSSRAISLSDTGYGSSFYIYNNIFIGGNPADGIIRGRATYVYIWNNTFYDVGTPIYLFIGGQAGNIPEDISIVNNIFYVKGTADSYLFVSSDPGWPIPTIDSNCYYGNGPYTGGDDAHMINADSQFVNPSAGDLRLQPDSPCIDKGNSLVSTIVQTDHNGVIRPQGSAYDIGAYEYVSPTIRGDVNGDGLVNVVDVQLAVNQFLGIIPQTQEADLNGDGVVNVIDVQLVVNIILSLAT